MSLSTLKLAVNQENIVKSLALYSFTNNTTFISELLQNSRRSGASEIHINFNMDDNVSVFSIIDNGKGLDNFEDLLTLAQSGWSSDIVETEKPFGMGFLSALSSAEEISFYSNGFGFTERTQDILSFKPIVLHHFPESSGTKVVLRNMKFDISDIDFDKVIKNMVCGFSTPVFFNGKLLENHYSETSLSGLINIEGLGKAYLPGFSDKGEAGFAFDLYLQGFCIYSSHSHHLYSYRRIPSVSVRRNIIHLDSSIFTARLPDRDRLNNEAQVVKLVEEKLKKFFINNIAEMVFRGLDFDVSDRFYNIIAEFDLWFLFDNCEVINQKLLFCYDSTPTSLIHQSNHYYVANHVFKKDIITERKPIVFIAKGSSFVHEIAADSINALCISENIYRESHWIYPYVRNLSEGDVIIESLGDVSKKDYCGYWNRFSVVFCESYNIKIGQHIFNIKDVAFYDEDCETMYYPSNCDDTDALQQVSSFSTEYDDFVEEAYDCEVDYFSRFISLHRGGTPEHVLKDILFKSSLQSLDIDIASIVFLKQSNEKYQGTSYLQVKSLYQLFDILAEDLSADKVKIESIFMDFIK